MPPRGKRGGRKALEKLENVVSTEPQPKTTTKRGRGRPTGKAKENRKMEEQASKKRKQDPPAEKGKQNGDEVPLSKRRKEKGSESPAEETDAIILAPRPAVTFSEPMEIETISHPSHSSTPGEVMVLGQGDVGQLGLGEDVMERKKPFPVGGALAGKNVVQVTCGGMHTVALTDKGEVFTWGCNDEGALGRKIEGEGGEYTPGIVEKMGHVKIVQVSAGDSHTAALANNGNVYCWGVFRDSNGPFGLVKCNPSFAPELVYTSTFNKALKVVSGSDHVVILTEQGDLYTFGCGEQGQLGRIPECFSTRGGRKGISMLLHPQVVRFRKARGLPPPKFSDIFCGSYHTLAFTKDQGVYAWGLNNYGQLGTNDVKTRFQPERLPSDWIAESTAPKKQQQEQKPLQIVGGQHHTVLCQNGSVFAVGRKEYGRLGLGENTEDCLAPKKIPDLQNVTTVAAGTACSFAVTAPGELFSWGMGTSLQLGTGSEEDVWVPVKVTGKKIENRRILNISAGGQHTALLVSRPEAVE